MATEKTVKNETTTQKKLQMSPPWCEYYHEVQEMFRYDDSVFIRFDEENGILKICVDDPKKYEALSFLMPEEKSFGDVILKIEVVPSNLFKSRVHPIKDKNEITEVGELLNLYTNAFRGNGAFGCIKIVDGWFSAVYVMFNQMVVQYPNDNLNDYYGNKSCLYQDLANDIFRNINGVFYCTDICDIRTVSRF